jgi:hypothetical protein
MSSTPGNREVAHRLFAAEFEESSYSYSESDEERAPNYVVTPTGARVNRAFVSGVLTEVAQAGESILRARVVDPTGAFVVYAGQYQPEAMAYLDDAEAPSFVAVTGKARTFQPDDSDLVYTSLRPESVSEVDAPTRDRWTVTAAERTLERIGVFAAALDSGLTGDALAEALREAGVDASLAAGVPIAIEQYGTTKAYLAALEEVALDAVRLVADEADEVGDLTHAPDEGGDVSFTPARPADVELTAAAAGVADSATPEASLDAAGDVEATTPDAAAATDAPDATGDPVEEPAADPVEEGVDDGPEPTGEPVAEEGAAGATATDGASETPDAEAAAGDAVDPSDAESEVEVDDPPATDDGATASDAPADDGPGETGAAAETGTDATDGTTAPDPDGAPEPAPDDAEGDEDPGAFEMDDETRQEVESEFGTEFSTGNEVDPAGEADIETPDDEAGEAADVDADATTADAEPTPDATPEEEPAGAPDEPSFEPTTAEDPAGAGPADADSGPPAAETDDGSTDADTEAETDADAGTGADADAEADADPDVDLETVLLEEMKALDDGDGAPREELVARVADRAGTDADAVDDAIQDALMSGQCYEPEDGRLKPI